MKSGLNDENAAHVHRTSLLWCAFVALLLGYATSSTAASVCKGDVALQVLGSGGQVPEAHRASSGYLVWIDGRSRVLVDAGGGVFLRFGDAHARIEDLSLIALTHFHADHVADFPALIKAGFFSERSAPLPVSGPSADQEFPGLKKFLSTEFANPGGAFAYLAGALDGSEGLFKLEPTEVDIHSDSPQVVLDLHGLTVMAAPVTHGPVPALGYLVRTSTHTIAFSGDQNGENPAFWKMVESADILVMHMAVPEDADPVAGRLHARPSVIGAKAEAAARQTPRVESSDGAQSCPAARQSANHSPALQRTHQRGSGSCLFCSLNQPNRICFRTYLKIPFALSPSASSGQATRRRRGACVPDSIRG
jgi:ribonuclease BN (tRNA processing enzyme)